MNLAAASLLCQLAVGANCVEDVDALVLALQQQAVQLFADPPAATASQATTEEERLLLARAVGQLHSAGLSRHAAYFSSAAYHPTAAFFIHTLLGALSGDRRRWFPRLQLEALRACAAVVAAVGTTTARCVLPGVVSACVRYGCRARHGADTAATRAAAVDLLRCAAVLALGSGKEEEEEEGDGDRAGAWLRDAAEPLARGVSRLLDPDGLTDAALPAPVAHALRRLCGELLRLPATRTAAAAPLARPLLAAHGILASVALLRGWASGEGARGSLSLPPELLAVPAVADGLRAALAELRGVALLHFAAALLRDEATRGAVLGGDGEGDGDEAEGSLPRLLHRCARLIGTDMTADDLYARRSATGSDASDVVDEFLSAAAYAAARCEAGRRAAERFLDECERALADWDLYALHPAIIYAAMRLVAWQFRMPAWAPQDQPARPAADLIPSGAFEALWAAVAQPHLWDTSTDAALCSAQQLRHREVVAATTLCGLEAVALVMRRSSSGTAEENAGHVKDPRHARAVRRLCVLVLYIVLEKASAPPPVGDAAVRVLDALAAADGHSGAALPFLIAHGDFVVDEASRAVADEALRPAATAVLRAGVSLILRESARATDSTDVPALADFAAGAVRVAVASCRRAANDGDAAGVRAAAALLDDCFAAAAALNARVPQLAIDDEDDAADERLTTSAEPRVALLQYAVLEAVRMLLVYTMRADAAAPAAIRAVVGGIYALRTTPAALRGEEPREEQREEQGEEHGGEQGEEEHGEERGGPPRLVAWDRSAAPVLPRALLRTVHQTAIAFVAVLREPVAALPPPCPSRPRPPAERRTLLAVTPIPAVAAALDGLAALFAVAPDFLARRVVEEFVPAALAWYERGAAPAIPTATDEKVRNAAANFIRGFAAADPGLAGEVRLVCESVFPAAIT